MTSNDGAESSRGDEHETERRRIAKIVMDKLAKQDISDMDAPMYKNMGGYGLGSLVCSNFRAIAFNRMIAINTVVREATEKKSSPDEFKSMLDKANEEFVKYAESELKEKLLEKFRKWLEDDAEYERARWRVKQASEDLLKTYKKTKHLYI